MASAEREPITGIWDIGPLKLVTFLYSECISCALLVAYCIGATAALCAKFANLAPK